VLAQIKDSRQSSYLDVDISLLPLLRLILLPFHVALTGVLVEAHPSLEFIVCSHFEYEDGVVVVDGMFL
jgi:hypothetical protein